MNVLQFITQFMEGLGIPYEFGTWTQSQNQTRSIDPSSGTWRENGVSDPYFVGEYTETESYEREENGYQETTFLLTGTGTSWINLERAKNIIKEHLPKTAILEDHSGIAVFYGYSLPIPTGDAELKRIQINLTIKEWSVR